MASSLPYLRRYARAVTGSQSMGDNLVRMTLSAALEDETLLESISADRAGLYRAFTIVWASVDPDVGREGVAPAPDTISQLGRVSTLRRQALLLNQLEDFSIAEAAHILGVTGEEAETLVKEAFADIARDSVADVLIIEDEPLISSHLTDIVESAGHRIVATAATAAQAREAYALHRPSLVLSDIQLADGSSGIDAVEDILRIGPVPVIFITAFPEKLLTGEGLEPTLLISKPFREETVLTTISQALFFGSNLNA
ncbi:MAG: response regulator [Sphingomonadales bacterium]|nr:response regulator [Sphingomonadales bacterium]MDE2169162.1 response regulator [Sphingomonadales bacterium]